MLELISRLRQRPEKDRRRIALTSAVVITLGVVIIWAVSLVAGKSSGEATISPESPTGSLWLQMKSGIGAFIDSVTD